jgi:hypothetical protein
MCQCAAIDDISMPIAVAVQYSILSIFYMLSELIPTCPASRDTRGTARRKEQDIADLNMVRCTIKDT